MKKKRLMFKFEKIIWSTKFHCELWHFKTKFNLQKSKVGGGQFMIMAWGSDKKITFENLLSREIIWINSDS